MNVLGSRAEDDDVEVLVCHLAALAAGDEDSWKCKAVSDLAERGRQTVKAWRRSVLAEIVIDNTSNEQIQHQLHAYQQSKTFAEVGGLAHLRDDRQVTWDGTKADKEIEHVEETTKEVDLDTRSGTKSDDPDWRSICGCVLRPRDPTGDHGKDDDNDDRGERHKGGN